jgi:2-aminoadipate transaminase
MTIDELAQGTERDAISLLLGHPDPTTLLTPEMQEAIHSFLSQPRAYTALQYGADHGPKSLVTYLMAKLNREQGLDLKPGRLMIVAGSTHAVDMITRLFVTPGSVVLIEAPTYADSIHIFRDHRIDLRSVPMDENGLIVSELERLLARLRADGKTVSFLYTIPNFHNPTGITLAEDRRVEIIRLAQEYGFLIIEDDVYRELRFGDTVPASFYALSKGKQVLSIGSFSKTLAPGLRLGWLVGPEESIERCVECGTTQMGGGANPFAANIVGEYCRQGHWEPHIARLRSLYAKRRDLALSALSRHMPRDVTWTHPDGGFFIWLRLPDNVFAQEVTRAAEAAGLLLAAGEGFYLNPADGAHNLRIAFSFAPPDDIEAGIKILGQVIEKLKTVERA